MSSSWTPFACWWSVLAFATCGSNANAENQLEAETESPWQPKSVLAFLDCLEAIKYALILIELGPEKDICQYIDWFGKQARSRPQRIEQLRVYWETCSWRVALALRSKETFEHAVRDIMLDTQSLQEAVNKEIAIEKPAKGKGKKGSGKSFDDTRWLPYNHGYYNDWGRNWASSSWSNATWQRNSDQEKSGAWDRDSSAGHLTRVDPAAFA